MNKKPFDYNDSDLYYQEKIGDWWATIRKVPFTSIEKSIMRKQKKQKRIIVNIKEKDSIELLNEKIKKAIIDFEQKTNYS